MITSENFNQIKTAINDLTHGQKIIYYVGSLSADLPSSMIADQLKFHDACLKNGIVFSQKKIRNGKYEYSAKKPAEKRILTYGN